MSLLLNTTDTGKKRMHLGGIEDGINEILQKRKRRKI